MGRLQKLAFKLLRGRSSGPSPHVDFDPMTTFHDFSAPTIDGTDWIDQDVPELTSFPAYVGFTAATGSVTNYHLIDALQVEEFVCDGE